VLTEDEQLRLISRKNEQKKGKTPGRLGDVFSDFIARLEPMQKKNTTVEQVWDDILPDSLKKCCKCAGIKAGKVHIKVASPVYMYQLQIRSTELVQKMNEVAPRLKIKELKLSIGSLS
jgi:hypothetical protein